MGRTSREKGKRGERELAHKLEELTGLSCRRGQQYSGSETSADVVGLPGIHIECKRVERLDLASAMEQAVHDCGENIPTVMHRRNGGEWMVTMRLTDWVKLYKDLNERLLEYVGRV